LDAQAIGRVSEAPHFRYRYEYADGFEILHLRASALFPQGEQYVHFVSVYYIQETQ
jgi:hypothetical protein